jgi:hypothetical protein
MKGLALPMNVTAGLFKQVRLVSASLRLFTSQSSNNATAKVVIASGNVNMVSNIVATGGTPTGGVTTYSDFTKFQTVDNMKNRAVAKFQNAQEARAIWLPQTNDDTEAFIDMNQTCYQASNGSPVPCGAIAAYISGAPAATLIGGEVYLNVEFVAEPNTIFSDMAWTTNDDEFPYSILKHLRGCPEEICQGSSDLDGELGKMASVVKSVPKDLPDEVFRPEGYDISHGIRFTRPRGNN